MIITIIKRKFCKSSEHFTKNMTEGGWGRGGGMGDRVGGGGGGGN